MLLKRAVTLSVLAIAASVSQSNAAQYTDTFDVINAPGVTPWVDDRFGPAGFEVENLAGENVLAITVSADDRDGNRGAQNGSFYNYQGKQRALDGSTIWTVTADLYVTSSMISATDGIHNTSFWIRTSVDGTESTAYYAAIAFSNFDPADAFNPSATGRFARFRTWGSAGWQNAALLLAEGVHTLTIVGSGTFISMQINGIEVATDTVAPGSKLTNQYIQLYNHHTETYGGSTTVHWDNVSGPQAVPEPTTGAFLLLGMAAIALRRKRRRLVK